MPLEVDLDGNAYVDLDLVRWTMPSLSNVTSQSADMLEVAARFGVEYDGWGCAVVR